MSTRAGIVVTGTEVLHGIIADRNGPWLSERLRDIGVDLLQIAVVGDRPDDLLEALRFLERQRVALIITSGGLGPTADDLTTEVVARFAERPLVLDAALEGRIAAILERLTRRWHDIDRAAISAGNRKQAMIPQGATILEPVGTAPGLVVPPRVDDGPTVVVLPGPPAELQPMWHAALATPALQAALTDAVSYRQRILRLYGIPESEIAATLRTIAADGVDLGPLEITTCLRRSEIEVAVRYEAGGQHAYDAFEQAIARRHGEMLFSTDGSTIDEQVARLLDGRTVAVAESCTGGLLCGRLTDLPGASAYVLGGMVVYSNAAKIALADVAPELLERYGAVSREVAQALAGGARRRFGAELGIGVTGIAGPGGGTPEKPPGRVHVCVEGPAGERLARQADLPGNRAIVRDRATTLALHLLRRLLRGEADAPSPAPR